MLLIDCHLSSNHDIGNKLFISQEYTNVGIKRQVENKTKTYLQRLNMFTGKEHIHMAICGWQGDAHGEDEPPGAI